MFGPEYGKAIVGALYLAAAIILAAGICICALIAWVLI